MATLSELAKRLGVSKSAVQKCVRSEFETASLNKVKCRGGYAIDLTEQQANTVIMWFADNADTVSGSVDKAVSKTASETASESGSELASASSLSVQVELLERLLDEKDARIAEKDMEIERLRLDLDEERQRVRDLEKARSVPFWKRLLGSGSV